MGKKEPERPTGKLPGYFDEEMHTTGFDASINYQKLLDEIAKCASLVELIELLKRMLPAANIIRKTEDTAPLIEYEEIIERIKHYEKLARQHTSTGKGWDNATWNLLLKDVKIPLLFFQKHFKKKKEGYSLRSLIRDLLIKEYPNILNTLPVGLRAHYLDSQ